MSYVLATGSSELERLHLQSLVWEPAGRQLLARIPSHAGARVLDVGCGAFGWLRVLSEWTGRGGGVLGTDIDPAMIQASRETVAQMKLANVEVTEDDLFTSALGPASFDLVHARFEIAPLGRAEEQIAAHLRLCSHDGWLVLEEPDTSSWRFNPSAPANARLIDLIGEGFRRAGGDLDAGRRLHDLMRSFGLEPEIAAQAVALPAGHPYLELPVQLAKSMRDRLVQLVGESELDQLLSSADSELNDVRWGTTLMLIQAWAAISRSAQE